MDSGRDWKKKESQVRLSRLLGGSFWGDVLAQFELSLR